MFPLEVAIELCNAKGLVITKVRGKLMDQCLLVSFQPRLELE